MKRKLLCFILYAILLTGLEAEDYRIFWKQDPAYQTYSLDVYCVETGFSVWKRGSFNENQITVNLLDGFTYKIKLISYDDNNGYTISNTLNIKTKNKNKNSRLTAPTIEYEKIKE